MIVISRSLALLNAQIAGLWRPIIGWHNLVTAAGISADSEAAGYPVTNLANPSSVEGWRSDSDIDQVVAVTISTTSAIDYVGVQGHNWGSAGIAVSVWGQTADETPEWVELVESSLLGADAPAILRFEAGFYQAVEVRLSPDSEAPVEPIASVLFVGKLIEMRCGLQPGHIPVTFSSTKNTQHNLAEDGHYLGSVVLGESAGTSAEFRMIDPDEYRANVEPFRKAGKGTTFFWSWAPADYPDEVGYAWIINDPKATVSQRTGLIDIGFQFGAMIS